MKRGMSAGMVITAFVHLVSTSAVLSQQRTLP